MSISFRPAKRENVPLLIGLAGGTGSGKTYSALLIARGLAGGEPFAFVDTENGRGKHYAELFPEMRHGEIHAPFRPQKYADAIQAGAEFPVVVVDSMSHEWAGDGGCLDWHDELMKGDQRKNLSAWIEPKREHKRMVTRLLQVGAHVILCFRAEPKVEAVRQQDGSTKIIAKPSLTGLDGWIPISEKMLPYELTASFLLMADKPGVPRPIKLEEQHRQFVPLDRPLTEETGRLLGEWARGSEGSPAGDKATPVTVPNDARADEPRPVAPLPSDDSRVISADQRKRLYTIATNAKVPDDEVKRIMFEIAGVASSKELRVSEYDLVVATVQKWQPAGSSFEAMLPAGVKGAA